MFGISCFYIWLFCSFVCFSWLGVFCVHVSTDTLGCDLIYYFAQLIDYVLLFIMNVCFLCLCMSVCAVCVRVCANVCLCVRAYLCVYVCETFSNTYQLSSRSFINCFVSKHHLYSTSVLISHIIYAGFSTLTLLCMRPPVLLAACTMGLIHYIITLFLFESIKDVFSPFCCWSRFCHDDS